MNRTIVNFVLAAGLLLSSTAVAAQARTVSAPLTPEFCRFMLRCAGIHSHIITSGDGGAGPTSLFIPDLQGSAVVVAFPPGGLRPNDVLVVEIDGKLAAVARTQREFFYVEGDRGVVASGIFGTIECIINALSSYLDAALTALLDLDIFGFLDAIVSGIFAIINCIVF